MTKNSCTPINPKKYSCLVLKKIHTRNLKFDNEKNSCGSKIPHPHYNFSNGPSLTTPTPSLVKTSLKCTYLCSQYSYGIVLIKTQILYTFVSVPNTVSMVRFPLNSFKGK